MDYEKAYKEALSRAKSFELPEYKNIMASIFPELAESEDEKIRKALVDALNKNLGNGIEKYGTTLNAALTWLEKQADKEKDKRYEYLEELIVADDIYQMSMNEEMIKNSKSKVIDALDKLHLLELLGIEKENEKKFIDSVKHKFNVGDWLVSIYNSNDLLHIIGVDDKDYEVETPYGNTGVPSIVYVDGHFRLWTINDAKDGDVLISKNGNPFIYNGNYNSLHIGAYCGITCDDNKFKVGEEKCHWTENTGIEPSTKEQRDTLFTKMKESGYEFDFKKKELNKKIEQKFVDKIEPKFKVGDWVVTDKNDRVQIKAVNNSYYTIDNGMYFNIPYADKYWHLWTIQDAKDGDVLIVERDKTPFIFKEFDKFHPGCPVAYCGIDDSGIFVNSGDGWWTDEEVYPATKEQRDQHEKQWLMQDMHLILIRKS